ncbi:hypothetical protein LUZ63_023536 [Rhynchospora breviuscula]|uniref:glycerol kinase n=1 Tax=Rhynchospora breviuscula TaxID=2022672 RepID=A0A9P9Z2P7_9POAL|nr:hypothetical protein LUZ63_023536 [Rhynchospora breviuscula]
MDRPAGSPSHRLSSHSITPHSAGSSMTRRDIWRDALATARKAIEDSGVAAVQIAAIGITNQRETAVVWDRATGEPIHRAIVWQDRRGTELCQTLKADGVEDLVRERTGLLIDPYFSATKLAWLLDHVEGARGRAERGRAGVRHDRQLPALAADRRAVHATDITNASRTMLFDIHRGVWDEELCRLLRVPMAMLPDVHDNAHVFGTTTPDLLGAAIPIAGMAGGPAGRIHRLLTTPAYRLNGRTTYALEGSIFVAGAAVKWLRDGLGVITHASQTDDLATQVPDSHGVYMVPAFVGMGAPYWEPDARGAIYGLTLGASAAHLARAALESVAYQTMDLAEAMKADAGEGPAILRVDGGMAANDWLCRFLANMIQTPVERPADLETTARGAAFHAGLATGVWSGLDALEQLWSREACFEPGMAGDARAPLVAGWRDAVARTLAKPVA